VIRSNPLEVQALGGYARDVKIKKGRAGLDSLSRCSPGRLPNCPKVWLGSLLDCLMPISLIPFSFQSPRSCTPTIRAYRRLFSFSERKTCESRVVTRFVFGAERTSVDQRAGEMALKGTASVQWGDRTECHGLSGCQDSEQDTRASGQSSHRISLHADSTTSLEDLNLIVRMAILQYDWSGSNGHEQKSRVGGRFGPSLDRERPREP
jgi:hypothetical protein